MLSHLPQYEAGTMSILPHASVSDAMQALTLEHGAELHCSSMVGQKISTSPPDSLLPPCCRRHTAPMSQTFPEIDGYQITRCIKERGTACVYVGVDKMLQMDVVIEVVSLIDGDHESSARLELQAQRWLRLRHPHIIPLYRFGRVGQTFYYVMPLLTGGDLRTWEFPADENKVRALLADLLGALNAVYTVGVLHRAIKPKHVLFDRHGRAHLTGFTLIDRASNTEADELYSLAVFAFELLTGKRTHALSAPLTPQFSDWQNFFLCALHPQPTLRFENAVHMKAALSGTKKAASPTKLELITSGYAAKI